MKVEEKLRKLEDVPVVVVEAQVVDVVLDVVLDPDELEDELMDDETLEVDPPGNSVEVLLDELAGE